MNYKTPYQRCSMCEKEWANKDEFLSDHTLKIKGYQACFKRPEEGAFLFTHLLENCHSTLALPIQDLEHLYEGSRYIVCRAGNNDCPMYCLDAYNLMTCSNECSMAWVRTLLQVFMRQQTEV